MWITNYIALIGWLLFGIITFSSRPPQKTIILLILGAFLFLPMSSIKIHGLPPGLNKTTVVAFAIFSGEILSGVKAKFPLKNSFYDLPNIIYCFVVPLASSLSNGLGLYDGVSDIVTRVFTWGVFFWAGRRYFGTPSSMRALTTAMMIGGLIYIPFILFELRMSPMLHKKIYGFFSGSFHQAIRYGGYRPVVFMPHGLVVSIWISATTTITFWLWRTKEITKAWKLPASLAWVALVVSTVLCKSANGIIFMFLGIITYFIFNRTHSSKPLRWLLLIIPIYFYLRLSGVISVAQIGTFMARYIDPERLDSLLVRVSQEDFFGARALLHPLFGWGWMDRAWPVDQATGAKLVQVVDSIWIITFGSSGFLGLASCYLSLGLGPLLVLAGSKKYKRPNESNTQPYAIDAVILSIVVAFFLIDSMMNSALPPIIILCSGALVTYHQRGKNYIEEIA
jgi:hypothetical protein